MTSFQKAHEYSGKDVLKKIKNKQKQISQSTLLIFDKKEL